MKFQTTFQATIPERDRRACVRHIATCAPCTSGGAGIGVDSYYRGVQSDVIGNSVHDNSVHDNKNGISEQGATGRHDAYRNKLVFQNATLDWRLPAAPAEPSMKYYVACGTSMK